MTTPDIWFTLYSLARKGALHRSITITTSELGGVLGISQQTASRRISYCVDEGFVARTHTAAGMLLQITERGRRELSEVLGELEIAFVPPGDEIVIRGSVTHGLGEGAYYVEVYATRFREALGFLPFSGTLNVIIREEESRKATTRMRQSPPLIVHGFSYEGRTFGDVICYRVKVDNAVEGAVVIAQRTHHSENTLEVIAPYDLREKLGLEDEDIVELTVIPLHMAT
ncbi:MAG: CTP-dependent riboflavin kinase [Candidatus Thorarchaeota archaeon]|nr:MAG: CTP-dependent riboflavin kinase [Candidatus Thorarchaeota archaeon]